MPSGEVVNRSRLAVVFGVARTTVDAWVAEGCPMIKRPASKGDPAEFDTAEVHAWLIKRAVTRATADRPAAGDQLDLEAERALLAREQRIAQEMKNQAARGQLLPRAEVTAAVQSAFTRVRARMLALPTKAAPQVASLRTLAEIKTVLTELVHEALRELSETEVVALAEGGAPA